MFRIRRVVDDSLPVNQNALGEVQRMLASQFPGILREEIDKLPEKLRNPFQEHFCAMLYVAEHLRGQILGFALLMHDPQLRFCYLDYLASAKPIKGRGIGAALYERVRSEALAFKSFGLFYECLPDDPALCPDPQWRRQNAARLRFYERYGARPIVGTAYESPPSPHYVGTLPHLVFDGLDQSQPLRAADARRVVQAILERKYSHLCPPEYIRNVVTSFRDDPVKLRGFRYVKREPVSPPAIMRRHDRMAMVVSDKHEIHHVRERGYVESPVRIRSIRNELAGSGLIETLPIREYPMKHIAAVHDRGFVNYLRRACANVPQGKSVYPYVFPIRNQARPPKELSVRAGYYCIDTFTPLNQYVLPAARRAVDCALTAADEILHGRRVAYALIRPPGHHAERRSFGGFCYFNNTAIAANYLSAFGSVAIVDVDYHHGNGQQDIFYERRDVLTVSIHGGPDFAYPYFTGFADERGLGDGEGYNLNIPLPEIQRGEHYRRALRKALDAVARFRPTFLVVALGLDTAKGDPTGTWLLSPKDFAENGRMIRSVGLPTLVIQEGGYRTRTLGVNARSFFQGLVGGGEDTRR